MSSSGIQSLSSGPLIIRTYNDSSSSNLTYILKDYDRPVPSNYVLITSTNGQLVPSDNIRVSSITTSSYNSDSIHVSTAYISSIFGFSPVQFHSPVRINNTNPPTDEPQLFVNGSIVFSEPGAQSTTKNAGVTIWGLPNGNPIYSSIETSQTIDINEPLSKINFQLIGSGGTSTFSNPLIINQDNPGYGAYIAGTLKVKQGDKLQFFIGSIGSIGSKGTSMVYFSSIGNGNFVSTLVCVAGAGGDNGFSPEFISSSSGGGHGGGASGGITTSGNIDFYAFGTDGIDGLSTINGNLQSIADGGQGGQKEGGIGGGGNAGTGQNSSINTLLINGGLVLGGSGGNDNTKHGGYGGGGYTGGGGGEAGLTTSAGGGGGSSYIAVSTLSNCLSNVVCLGGQWISQHNATPFGQDYGLPNNPGFAEITGYEPNDTLCTNGDIECRVLRYEMLDPPINAIGGQSALWSIYPAIDVVHMNDNPILECGGIHIDSGGADIKNIVNIRAGSNDTLDTSGFISQFIRTSSSGTYTIDYQVANDSTGFGSNTWHDARYVYNSGNNPDISQVWGIVTSSNITPVGSTIGDIHFYKSVYVDGKVGIGTINPATNLQIIGTTSTNSLITSSITTNYDSLSITAPNISTIGDLNVTGSLRASDASFPYINTDNISSGTVNTGLLNVNTISSGTMSTAVINMPVNEGQLVNVSTINGIVYSPDDINWTENGINIYNNNVGNIGIGTQSPQAKLDVNGTINTTSTLQMNDNIILQGNTSYGTFRIGQNPVGALNLGTFTITQQQAGHTLTISIASHSGFNAYSFQNQRTTLFFKLSNNAISQLGTGGGTFFGDAFAQIEDRQIFATVSPSYFRIVQNSNTSYTIFAYFGPLGTSNANANNSFYTVNCVGNWIHSGTAATLPTSSTYLDVTPFTGLNVSGNVGIGTTTSQAKLDVNGDIESNSNIISQSTIVLENRLRFNFTTNDNTSYIQSGNGTGATGTAGNLFIGNWFQNSTASDRKIMFLANGNVGINTTTPQTRLDVNGPTMFGSTNRFIFDSGMATEQKGMSFRYESNTGFIQAEHQGSAYQNLALNPFGGNVGIGISTPQTKLEVNGNIRTSGYLSTNTIQMNSGGIVGVTTINGAAYPTSDTNWLEDNNNNIYSNNTGNVGIGISIPEAKLHVNGSIIGTITEAITINVSDIIRPANSNPGPFNVGSIPSWVKRIHILTNRISIDDTSAIIIRLPNEADKAITYNSIGSALINNSVSSKQSMSLDSKVQLSLGGFFIYANANTHKTTVHMTITKINNTMWISDHTGLLEVYDTGGTLINTGSVMGGGIATIIDSPGRPANTDLMVLNSNPPTRFSPEGSVTMWFEG